MVEAEENGSSGPLGVRNRNRGGDHEPQEQEAAAPPETRKHANGTLWNGIKRCGHDDVGAHGYSVAVVAQARRCAWGGHTRQRGHTPRRRTSHGTLQGAAGESNAAEQSRGIGEGRLEQYRRLKGVDVGIVVVDRRHSHGHGLFGAVAATQVPEEDVSLPIVGSVGRSAGKLHTDACAVLCVE